MKREQDRKKIKQAGAHLPQRRSLKIAQIAPIIERVPPKKYGGTERVVHALCEELVKKGHDVTLFASGDSITSAKLVSIYPRSLREVKMSDLYGPNTWSLLNIGFAYSRQDDFDIIHDHADYLSLPVANIARTPVVKTVHGAFMLQNRKIFEVLNKPKLVTISHSQASFAPQANHIRTVYNGLFMDYYPYSPAHGGYLLFVGRICMEKGTHLAIEVAQYLDLPLIIAAKLDAVDVQYFNEYIGPKLSDERIRWVGEVDEDARNRLMARAICLLHPITWREPFGLTMIEAMACGCPVIGFNRGSVPELVEDGKTGYVVETVDEMIDAVLNVNKISRLDCRKRALENFSAEKMAHNYEEVYNQILQ